MGIPHGPIDAVRTEVLFDLAGDFFIFSIAMFGVCVLAVALTSICIARSRPTPRLASWTLLIAVLSVLAWAEFWRLGLVET